jgi:hypothetical protein
MAHGHVYPISNDKASLRRLSDNLHRKAHMFAWAHRCARFAMATTWSHGIGGCANLCPCIDMHPWEWPGGWRLLEQWATLALHDRSAPYYLGNSMLSYLQHEYSLWWRYKTRLFVTELPQKWGIHLSGSRPGDSRQTKNAANAHMKH